MTVLACIVPPFLIRRLVADPVLRYRFSFFLRDGPYSFFFLFFGVLFDLVGLLRSGPFVLDYPARFSLRFSFGAVM